MQLNLEAQKHQILIGSETCMLIEIASTYLLFSIFVSYLFVFQPLVWFLMVQVRSSNLIRVSLSRSEHKGRGLELAVELCVFRDVTWNTSRKAAAPNVDEEERLKQARVHGWKSWSCKRHSWDDLWWATSPKIEMFQQDPVLSGKLRWNPIHTFSIRETPLLLSFVKLSDSWYSLKADVLSLPGLPED